MRGAGAEWGLPTLAGVTMRVQGGPMARRAWGILMIGVMVGLSACVAPAPPIATPSASPTPEVSSPTASPTATIDPEPEPSGTASPQTPPPDRVVGLTASVGGGSGEVLLRWSQNDGDVVSYIVLRALTPGGPVTQIGTVTPDQVDEFEIVPFVDTTAAVAYYRMRAVDASGQQGPSSVEVCGASVGYSC
ncbi:MAG: hypothetical protein C0444_02215 [Microbacterium sp.]|nr:hypothetical protein [Microbacterium sp.]MBA4346288.1 hypothetical protein [Microbacterium sp.]